MGGGAAGAASGATPAADAPPPAPDPVDIEAAREATDLVLDALRSQRDNPDPELLDRLGWTPEQLDRFLERWEQARRLRDRDAAAASEYEEALKSLGIRSGQRQGVRNLEQRSDALEQMRDAGGRATPPPQFRDSIEAVLRSVNR